MTVLEFQFLIGSLEAKEKDENWKEAPKFQFLIGSLEAFMTRARIERAIGFNSS